MDTSIPQNLVFDDQPLDGILYGVNCPEATLADILELWRGREDLPPECLGAVAAILAQEAEKGVLLESGRLESIVFHLEQSLAADGRNNPRELLKLARICHAAGRVEQAETSYRLALEYIDGAAILKREERFQAMNNLAKLLEQMGRVDDAEETLTVGKGEMLLADGKTEGLFTVRAMALELFVAGKHKAAEQLYKGLLARRFQQPGTLTHLVRVLLIQDRLPEARQAIAAAWKFLRNREVRQATPAYVLPRILFFRILCAMLARGNYARLVARIKKELLGNHSRETWTIEPVIAHIKPYLHLSDVNFLEVLSEAITSADNMDRLNAFPVWTGGEG